MRHFYGPPFDLQPGERRVTGTSAMHVWACNHRETGERLAMAWLTSGTKLIEMR